MQVPSPEEYSAQTPSFRDARYALRPHEARSGADGTVNSATSKRLLQAYFSFVHPTWPIIYKPLYDSVNHQTITGMLPRPVLYAMFAIVASSPLDPKASQDDTPSAAFFFEQAMQSMRNSADGQETSSDDSLDLFRSIRPSLEHCQVLTLLALQQHIHADSSRAYTLVNMAITMAIELRLDRVSVDKEGATSNQVKSRLWWALFVLEKTIASPLWRPFRLRTEDAGTPLPSVNESDEYELLQIRLPNNGGPVSTKAHTISGFHVAIQLAKIMDKMYQQIYSFTNRAKIREDPQTGEVFRLKLWEELQDLLARSNIGQGVDFLSSSASSSRLRNTLVRFQND